MMAECSEHATIQWSKMSAKGVRISKIPPNTPRKLLELYFKNTYKSGGGIIHHLFYEPGQDSIAIVIFEEDSIHWRVTERRHHYINNTLVEVELIIPATNAGSDAGVDSSERSHLLRRLDSDEVKKVLIEGDRDIASLLQACGCSMTVALSSESDNSWLCTLSGTPAATDCVDKQIDRLLSGSNSTTAATAAAASYSAHTDDRLTPAIHKTARNKNRELNAAPRRRSKHKYKGNVADITPTQQNPAGRPRRATPDGPKQQRANKLDASRSGGQRRSSEEVPIETPCQPTGAPLVDGTRDGASATRTPESPLTQTPGLACATNCPPCFSEEISIPRILTPFILGYSGKTIQSLESTWGVTIKIVPSANALPGICTPRGGKSSDSLCRLQGKRAADVAGAKAAVESIMVKYNIDKHLKPTGHGRGHQCKPTAAEIPDWIRTPKGYLIIPAHLCGLVIGKGGESIRNIQAVSGAVVHLNEHQSCKDIKVCCIVGTKDSMRIALALVAEKARLAYPEFCRSNLPRHLQQEPRDDGVSLCSRTFDWSSAGIFDWSSALFVSNLSPHTSREAICCWLQLATGHFPATMYFSLDGTKVIAKFRNSGIDEERAIAFAINNAIDNMTLKVKFLQATTRIQVHGIQQRVGIVELLQKLQEESPFRVVAGESLLKDTPVLVVHPMSVECEIVSVPSLGPEEIWITPHYDELGILRPEQILSGDDLSWADFLENCNTGFSLPCLLISGFSDKVDRKLLSSYLTNTKKSGGGDIQNLFVVENQAIVQFTDPNVVDHVHKKYMTDSLFIAGMQLQVALLKEPSQRSDRRRLRVKNIGEATIDSLKYVLWVACNTAVQKIQLVWTNDQDLDAIVTFMHEIDNVAAVFARMKVITLDGRSLEVEDTVPCTSLMIQNVPADMHKELLELALPQLDGDVGTCEKVAVHTWLAQFKCWSSIKALLSCGIRYMDEDFHVTANQQDFVPITGVGHHLGQRGTAKLKLDFLTPSLLKFITTARLAELQGLMKNHHARLEAGSGRMWAAYFTFHINERYYWLHHKKWRQLKHAISQFASQFVTFELSVVSELAEAWSEPLPHFQVFRDFVASKSNDLQLNVLFVLGASAGVLEFVGVRSAVDEARIAFAQSLSAPCHLEPDGSQCCHEIVHVEQSVDVLSLTLVDVIDFGRNYCNDRVSVQLLMKERKAVLQGRCVDVQWAFMDLRAILGRAVSKEIQGSVEWVELMKRDDVRSYVQAMLRAQAAELESNLVWSITTSTTVRLLATTGALADRGVEAIRAAVVDRLLPMSPGFVIATKTDVWYNDFKASVYMKYGDCVTLIVHEGSKQLQLTCCARNESSIRADLREFQRIHTLTSSFLELPDAVTDYINTYCKHDVEKIEKHLADNLVKIQHSDCDGKRNGFKLEGNEEGVQCARVAMERLQSNCKLKSERLAVPGAGTYFASNATRGELLLSIGTSTNTVVRVNPEPTNSVANPGDYEQAEAPKTLKGSSNMTWSAVDETSYGNVTFDSSLLKPGPNRHAGMMRQGKACMVKGTYVNVCLGDISEESTTFVVNCTGRELSLRGQVSRALVSKGGPEIAAECLLRGPIGSSGILVTSAGFLKCECIMHVDIRLDCEKIVQECLKKAEEFGADSIAFPAIGTGAYGKPVAAVAQSMVEAAVKFLRTQEHRHLKLVRFVIFDSHSLSFFDAALITTCSSKKKGLQELIDELIAKFKTKTTGSHSSYTQTYGAYFGYGDGEAGVAKDALAAAAVALISPMAVGITAPKSKVIDFDNSVEEQLLKQSHVDGLSRAISDAIKELPRATAVGYRICGACTEEIDSALQQLVSTCKSHLVTRKIKEPKEVISALTDSQLRSITDFGSWLDVDIEVDSMDHEISMTSLDEKSLSHASECLRDALLTQRREGAQVRCTPATWSITDGYSTPIVGMWMSEYKRVAAALHASLGSLWHQKYHVISITRVENTHLWQQYIAYKKKVKGTMAPSSTRDVERMLWHGTAEDAINSICHEGFNRSYCGKNAVLYGQGVYFAKDASYSAQDTYSVPNSQGEKCIIYSNVVTGEYEVGTSLTRIPRKKPHHSIATFECTVNDTQNPSIFVTYNDSQAYPAYVVRFKRN